MAKYGLQWIDSDMHLCDPMNLWAAYIDPQYKVWIPSWTGVAGKDHPLRNRGAVLMPGETPKGEGGAKPSDAVIFDSPFPEAFDRFMKIPGVSRESKAKILWDNCARLYNLS